MNKPKLKLLAKFGLVFLIFLAVCWLRLDPDFGWHLKAGGYYRQHWIPGHDIFTYTARNFPWINHEWGNDFLLSWLYALGGYGLLSVLYAGIWTAAFAVQALRVRAVFLLAAVAAVLPFAGIRPVAWTVLLFAALLKLLAGKKPPSYLSIAVLFAIWANLHAGFIIGLAVIFYYLCKTRRPVFAKLLGVGLLATFINPYGPRLYVEIGRTLFDPELHSQINEWNNLVLFKLSVVFVGLWWAGFVLYKRRPLRNWLGLGPLLFAAAMSASRNMPLFVIATVGDLENYYLKFRAEAPKSLSKSAKAILGLSGALIVGFIIYTAYPTFIPWKGREAGYPTQAVAYLTAHPCSGNLFNDYNYGGYLIWKLPSKPVYIDGRMPAWRDPSGQKYLDRSIAISKNPAARHQEFARYNIRCVLIRSSNTQLTNSLKNEGWQTKLTVNDSSLLETP